MIVGVGIDLIENGRFEEELGRGDWCLADGIFAESEIRRCKNRKQSRQWYPVCFAAKEAVLKALDVSVSDLSVFRDVELKRRSRGRYEVDVRGQLKARCDELRVKDITVCVTHGKKLTIASVVLNG